MLMILRIGGVIHIVFAVFHGMFWRLFDWPVALAPLSSDNRAIMQVLNIHVLFVLIVFAVLSIGYAREMISSRLGGVISAAIAAFWFLRAANQVVFWGAGTVESKGAVVVCAAIGCLYAAAAFSSVKSGD